MQLLLVYISCKIRLHFDVFINAYIILGSYSPTMLLLLIILLLFNTVLINFIILFSYMHIIYFYPVDPTSLSLFATHLQLFAKLHIFWLSQHSHKKGFKYPSQMMRCTIMIKLVHATSFFASLTLTC